MASWTRWTLCCNVWCITKNFYQESHALGDLILDVHAVLNDKDAGDLRFLRKLS